MPRPAPGLRARHRPDHRVSTGIGIRRAVDLAVRPELTWQRLSAGPGAKGHRWYHWALIQIHTGDRDYDSHGGSPALLVRRCRSGELAFDRTWTPHPVPLRELVRVAGRRWAIEEAFQAGTGLTGLDAHQVRRWTSWRRWTVLAMLAHAFLAVTAADRLPDRDLGDATNDATSATSSLTATPLAPLTCAEIRHLLAALIFTLARTVQHLMRWSRYRRTANARARTSPYARQAAALT